MAKNTVECPACSHSWPVAEKDVGLGNCPACGADIKVTRVLAWSYEAVAMRRPPHLAIVERP